jgi:hypothetical protein
VIKIITAIVLALVERALGYLQTKAEKAKADGQRNNDNRDRGGAGDVAARLRKRLDKT